jgi:hypothetical protein
MRWCLAVILTALCTSSTFADYRAWIGWDDLVARIGAEQVPTGDNVIVGQVEVATSNGAYIPDTSNAEFDGKYIVRRSGGPTTSSSHATSVGKRFYGLDGSIAPGIWFINCFEVNSWVQSGYLNVGQGAGSPPEDAVGAQKIWNHSWVGTFGDTNNDHDALRRTDWVIERDDVVFAVGVNNGDGGQALLSYGYNTIAVGRRDGAHAFGDVPEPYEGAGRMLPHITGPLYTTSDSTPVVAAAIAMLVEMVRTDDNLPEDAEQPEVLKSILLTAATHQGVEGEEWTNNSPESGPERGRTMRPLDDIVGAGHLQVDRAHEVMSGGRTVPASTVDDAPSASQHGWSFEPVSGGQAQWWKFSLPEGVDTLSVVATWNRDVPSSFSAGFVADIDLELFLWVDGDAVPLIGDELAFGSGNVASTSEVDNIEHLWIRDLAAGTYVLRAAHVDGGNGATSVATSWWTSGELGGLIGDVNGDGFIDIDDLLLMLSQWGQCSGCAGDLDDNNVVDVDDLLLLLSLL